MNFRNLSSTAGRVGRDGTRAASDQILSLIRSGSASTRAELIEQTGLSRSTVSQRIGALLESNLVIGAGHATSTGGRRPTILAFNGSAGVVIGAALGATSSRVAVVNLAGAVLAEHEEDHLISTGPIATLQGLHRQVAALLKQTGVEERDIWGVGLGLPGPVEFATGRPVSPPIMTGWDGFSVAEWIAERYECPVLVDNDVNVMALGERSMFWHKTQDLIFVKVGTGIGAGIIADGYLYRGAQGAAGDIGHIYLPGHDELVCDCGNVGCLEAVASGRALAAGLTAQGIPATNAREVAAHVRAGNTAAIMAVRQAGRDLGQVVAVLVNSFNPAAIILGGALSAAGDHLLAGVRETVYRRSPSLATRNLHIYFSSAREHAGVVGAAAMIVDHVLSGVGASATDAEP